jgi:hypothetical protein
LFKIQKLLWDVRRDLALAERYRREPDVVLDEYGIAGEEREEMRTLDFKALYGRGVNPYLLYFCALQLGVDRAEYYANLRGAES